MRPSAGPLSSAFSASTSSLNDIHDRRHRVRVLIPDTEHGVRHEPSSRMSELTSPERNVSHARSPSATADEIQSHLYRAFLDGRTADVALHARGSWEGVYKLHRVVLIQAGFFHSLFDGGFRESTAKLGTLDEQEVNVTFDDPNITRAAFEICIARLYGGGPPLHVDPALIPSRREPLTPAFSHAHISSSTTSLPISTPEGSHPASPRFLLSLLAAASYLNMPTLAAQALRLILRALSPRTVLRFLRFGIGKGIGPREDVDIQAEAAVGLEHVCRLVEPHSQFTSAATSRAPSIRTMSQKSVKEKNVEGALADLSLSNIQKEDPANSSELRITDTLSTNPNTDTFRSTSSYASELDPDDDEAPPLFLYGAVSNKIGEAAACWLCRWGEDMLALEEAAEAADVPSASPIPEPGPSRLAHTQQPAPRTDVPVIWRRGGLSARWVRALLSSDCFFVRDERARYDLARRVVELRRCAQAGVDAREEREWDELFARGIHYMHMSLDDLIDISHDVSPTTGTPYVPTSVVQAAHWDQSLLRQHITVQPVSRLSTSSPPRSPPPRDKELGLARTTAELLEALSDSQEKGQLNEQKSLYPVPVDSSTRIGDSAGLDGASDEQLFDVRPPAAISSSAGKAKGATFPPSAPTNFFGLLNAAGRPARACVASDATSGGTARWAPFPPMRFSVEFWGVDALREKARLHSRTVWAAGSLFNVYVQVVRRKGQPPQLGVYLHRQSSVDPCPVPSMPPMPHVFAGRETAQTQGHGGAGERRGSVNATRVTPEAPAALRASASTPSLTRPVSRGTTATTASGPSRSTTPNSTSTSPSSPGVGALAHFHSPSPQSTVVAPPTPPVQPYRDPRPVVLVHFTIVCASPTGGALTRFASAPDEFKISQSWGWKSSSLQAEESEEGETGEMLSKDVSLRATVIVGVV